MKPTIKVSIGGVAFHLEENAYRLLEQYLNRLHTHYEKFDGGKEIVDDIELRIAELLRERISSTEQAISETLIKEVIAILGYPEEIETDEEFSGNKFKEKNVRKKLYRDMDNKVLGGVCSGLAAYFNIDVVLVRVLFVVFFVGFSIFHFHLLGFSGGTTALIYIVLWIITPPAQTIQQRYEMHGEKPNIKNIQQKVEEKLRDAEHVIQKSSPVAGEIVRVVGKICLIFIGSILVLIAVSVLMAFIVAFASGYSIVNVLCINLMDYVNIDWHSGWFFGLLAVLLFLPFIGILYGGIKLLFGIKTKIKIGLIIFLLWIAALFTFVGMGIYHAQSFFYWRTAYEYVELPVIQYDTLYVDIPEKYYTEGNIEAVVDHINHWGFHKKKNHDSKCNKKVSKRKHKKNGYDNTAFNISNGKWLFFYQENKKATEKLLLMPVIDGWYPSDENNFGIEIHKDAAGYNFRNAYSRAKQIPFNYTLKDSLLIIEPLIYTKDSKWDGELLRLHFQIPEGKTIVLGKAFRKK